MAVYSGYGWCLPVLLADDGLWRGGVAVRRPPLLAPSQRRPLCLLLRCRAAAGHLRQSSWRGGRAEQQIILRAARCGELEPWLGRVQRQGLDHRHPLIRLRQTGLCSRALAAERVRRSGRGWHVVWADIADHCRDREARRGGVCRPHGDIALSCEPPPPSSEPHRRTSSTGDGLQQA